MQSWTEARIGRAFIPDSAFLAQSILLSLNFEVKNKPASLEAILVGNYDPASDGPTQQCLHFTKCRALSVKDELIFTSIHLGFS